MPSPEEVIQYKKLADDTALFRGVPRSLFRGMIEQESSWDAGAVSGDGARGLVQIIPKFHSKDQYGRPLDPYDPEQSLDYAAFTLRRYHDDALRLGYAATTREAWQVAIAGWHAGWPTIQA